MAFTDQINQLAQRQQGGLPQVQVDENGRKYMPTMQALKFLQDNKQQDFQNGLAESQVTGYYAPSDLRNTLDQIQSNKSINLSSQDAAAKTNAQTQNHALYSVLKNRYGIDGESLFNTADNNVNSQNMASAYRGMPTMSKQAQNWQQQYQTAGLTGLFNGSPTMQKLEMDNSNTYRDKSFGLQQDQFNFSKDKYNDSLMGDKATKGALAQMLGTSANRQDAIDYIQKNWAGLQTDGADLSVLMKGVDSFYPEMKMPNEKTATPKSRADLYEIYIKDPNAFDQDTKEPKMSFEEWLSNTGLGK